MSRGRNKRRTMRPKERKIDGEDRISRLPDDLIHRILSLTDARDAVQTSLLSTRWRNVWKSLSHLTLNRGFFSRMPDFLKFVTEYIRQRDQQSDLSVFNLNCFKGAIQRSLLLKIIAYGASHNLQHLNFSSDVRHFPPSVFTIQSLKQLSLTTHYRESINLLKVPVDLPALTTLFFERVSFELSRNNGTNKSDNFVSKLPNLKNLYLFECEIKGSEVFDINSSQLENLNIKYVLMEPHVEFVITAPKLFSFKYDGGKPLRISANDLHCLDKVYLNIGDHDYKYWKKQSVCREAVKMFHQLRDAKFVTVTSQTIRFLSWVLELLENQSCPFRKMECLKVENGYSTCHSTSSTGVLTYLCNSSPSCTIRNKCGISFPNSS